jgi:hypothetical protein
MAVPAIAASKRTTAVARVSWTVTNRVMAKKSESMASAAHAWCLYHPYFLRVGFPMLESGYAGYINDTTGAKGLRIPVA